MPSPSDCIAILSVSEFPLSRQVSFQKFKLIFLGEFQAKRVSLLNQLCLSVSVFQKEKLTPPPKKSCASPATFTLSFFLQSANTTGYIRFFDAPAFPFYEKESSFPSLIFVGSNLQLNYS